MSAFNEYFDKGDIYIIGKNIGKLVITDKHC